ncbi:MAG: DUF695 domain-containing protein [Marinicellaceae bacterium]
MQQDQPNNSLTKTITVIFLIMVVTAINSQALPESKTIQLNSEIKSIPDDWKLLEYKPSDSTEVWYFRKNMGAKNLLGHNSLKTLVYFTLEFLPKDQSGLPTAEDAGVLYVFEENIIPLVEDATSSVLVASVLKAGVKDHLFYVSNPELFIQVIGEYKPALSNFKISVEKSLDPKWETYTDFPDGS